jgi:Mg2+ and Co2+ transporter CorA
VSTASPPQEDQDAPGVAGGSERDAPAPASDGLSAFLYAADGEDVDVALEDIDFESLDENDLLWIDVDSSNDTATERLADLAPLKADLLGALPKDPFVRDLGEAFVIGVRPLGSDQDRARDSALLVCAVGRNWFVSIHEGDVGSLNAFADHLRGDSTLGRLDAPSFLAQILEWVMTAYFERLDELQETIDDVEVRILRERPRDAVVAQLVELRRAIGQLRRRLSPHRGVFIALAHPSFDVISGSSAAGEFSVLVERLETALQAVDTTREMVVGSFDVFMTRAAQRTNDIMRVLTLVSVLLLPASLIAGIFGMNMLPKYLVADWVFYAVLGGMALVAAGLLFTVLAFWRR